MSIENTKTVKGRISNKHGTEEYWILSVYTDATKAIKRANPFIPLSGELIIYDPDSIYDYQRFKFGNGVSNVCDLPFVGEDYVNLVVSNRYNESIIGLSVDGTTVTYIKGDGSTHSFETQDTNTTYSLGTDSVTGLTKLYATVGNAEDGTMTQKAIKTELDKKVGILMVDSNHTLIFTI